MNEIGLIAQDVQEVLPELVISGNDGYLAVAYDKVNAVLIEAIKEQNQTLDRLKQQQRQLDAQSDTLNQQLETVSQLEKRIKVLIKEKG